MVERDLENASKVQHAAACAGYACGVCVLLLLKQTDTICQIAEL